MDISFSLNLDSSGFLRRECPSCEREFKWFHGETEGKPDDFLEPENYTCPYCGTSAGSDSWWTTAQLEYAQSAAMGPIARDLKSKFGESFKADTSHQVSAPPPESDDMTIVEPPCHPFEPLKIINEWDQNVHCLLCGNEFRI